MASPNADQVYKDNSTIIAELVASWQSRMPDLVITPDSVVRIMTEIWANGFEGVFLSQALLHDDMFIQSMSALALQRAGEMFGRPQKVGTLATGEVTFGGSGGTYIPAGAVVGAPRARGDASTLLYVTTVDATIPNPGIPGAPTVVDAAVAGLLDGTYEWAVTFVTLGGESEVGESSDALSLSLSKATISDIPIGGPGTTARKLYRRVDGGDWEFLVLVDDNSTTDYTPDNAADGTLGGQPPAESTAERITVPVTADDIGYEYNVATGTVIALVDVLAGLSDVTNADAFTGGSDEEDIETFRRELLDFVRNPKSGSPKDLEDWAETIDGVEQATAFPNVDEAGDPAPGTVVVRIAGASGAIPDSDVVDATQALLDTKDLANITVIVTTFTNATVNVEVATTLDDNYNLTDVQPSIEQAITDYVNGVPVGGTVYKAGIIDAVFGLPGILTLTVTTPASDTTVDPTEKPLVGTITVS